MSDRPEDVIREARGDYIVGMRSQGYRAESVARLVAEFDAALSDLITERDRLREALTDLLREYEATGMEEKWGLPNVAAQDARSALSASPPGRDELVGPAKDYTGRGAAPASPPEQEEA